MFANMAKEMYDYIAVCRAKHRHEEMFTIPFDKEEQLSEFLIRNDGNVYEMGFYAKGFVNGEYVGENT